MVAWLRMVKVAAPCCDDGPWTGREQQRRARRDHEGVVEAGNFTGRLRARACRSFRSQGGNAQGQRRIGVIGDDGVLTTMPAPKRKTVEPSQWVFAPTTATTTLLAPCAAVLGVTSESSEARRDAEAGSAHDLRDGRRIRRGRDDRVAARRRFLIDAEQLTCAIVGPRIVRTLLTVMPRAEAERSGAVEGRELAEDVDRDVLRALHARTWIDDAQCRLRDDDLN